jgi:hypothetical protein
LVSGAWVLLGASPARADDEASAHSFWQAQAGFRQTFVTDPGFDPFSKNNGLPQLSLGLSRTVVERGAWSLAPGVAWEYGQVQGTARDHQTQLDTHRLSLMLEGRYHLFPWLYALARVAPGALHQAAQLRDPLAVAPLVASHWAFTVDASAGGAVLLGPWTQANSPRFWLVAEGGYGFTRQSALVLNPDVDEDDARRTGSLDLGTLTLSGAFVRAYVALTY